MGEAATREPGPDRDGAGARTVKCVVWDLDNTLWTGTLLEDAGVTLRPGVVETIRELDRRGILHSIASRNDPALALAKLEEFGLAEYFLSPQIGWGAKSDSVRSIVERLNIGADTVAFVDDEPFERDEVAFVLPSVRCIDAGRAATLADRADFTPRFVTAESAQRRHMYLADLRRDDEERTSQGPTELFLAGLAMRFVIAEATRDDLLRAEELTLRTNQLNTTGRTYSLEELDRFRTSRDHLLLMARLDDRYGPYGTIGLALVDLGAQVWTIRLLLMSCRVMSRGVGAILMNYIRNRARAAEVALQAEFVSNGRNRMMYATYKFSGFSEVSRDGDAATLACDLALPAEYPGYVTLVLPEAAR